MVNIDQNMAVHVCFDTQEKQWWALDKLMVQYNIAPVVIAGTSHGAINEHSFAV